MMITKEFNSNITNHTYPINQTVTCTTTNVIYVIQCSYCNIQYVGESGNTVQERMRNHRSTIKNHLKHLDKPVASHFSLPNHSINHLQVTIIETLGKQSKFRRQLREQFWIKTLDTFQPNGLNIRDW